MKLDQQVGNSIERRRTLTGAVDAILDTSFSRMAFRQESTVRRCKLRAITMPLPSSAALILW
jgi:hypothetical protein